MLVVVTTAVAVSVRSLARGVLRNVLLTAAEATEVPFRYIVMVVPSLFTTTCVALPALIGTEAVIMVLAWINVR